MNEQVDYSGKFASSREVHFHQHMGPELICVKEGQCSIEIQNIDQTNSLFDLQAGDVLLVPEATLHNQINHSEVVDHYIVCIPERDRWWSLPKKYSVGNEDFVLQWFEQIMALEKTGVSEIRHLLLQAILAQLKAMDTREAQSGHPIALKAKAHLEEHLQETLDIEKLARKFFISAPHLRRLWRQERNDSPSQYLLQCRMLRAEQLLKNDYLSLQDIASQVGCEDVNYFIRLFTRHKGTSPAKWRKILS